MYRTAFPKPCIVNNINASHRLPVHLRTTLSQRADCLIIATIYEPGQAGLVEECGSN